MQRSLLLLCFAFVICRLLFAVWFLFLCGCTFYVHKRISLNTKTTCGNSNNNKAKTHAQAHTHTHTPIHNTSATSREKGEGVYAIDKAMAKTAKALHLIISQNIETLRVGENAQSADKKRTWHALLNKTETHMTSCLCLYLCVRTWRMCVFVACWLSNDISGSCCRLCSLCIVI